MQNRKTSPNTPTSIETGGTLCGRSGISVKKSLGLADTEFLHWNGSRASLRVPEAMKKLGDNEVNPSGSLGGVNGGAQMFQSTKMAIHAAMVDRMDLEIGRFVGSIQAMGESEKHDDPVLFGQLGRALRLWFAMEATIQHLWAAKHRNSV